VDFIGEICIIIAGAIIVVGATYILISIYQNYKKSSSKPIAEIEEHDCF
jgi:hypothetical protein